jgi:hypothetical protein
MIDKFGCNYWKSTFYTSLEKQLKKYRNCKKQITFAD